MTEYKRWTEEEDKKLLDFVRDGLKMDDIAFRLDRTRAAVESRMYYTEMRGVINQKASRDRQEIVEFARQFSSFDEFYEGFRKRYPEVPYGLQKLLGLYKHRHDLRKSDLGVKEAVEEKPNVREDNRMAVVVPKKLVVAGKPSAGAAVVSDSDEILTKIFNEILVLNSIQRDMLALFIRLENGRK